jgi:formylglycine-generating enzyme required for sulfatase activity
MKKILLLAGILALLSGAALNAQVTIGKDKSPETFSVLELISNDTRGLRLPQLTTQERDDLQATPEFDAEKTDKAMGLQIFNLDTECVETWNGVTWIQACYNNTPTPPHIPLGSAISCGITPSNGNKTFTAKADLAAVKYEFFVGITSQGKQTTNTITFADAQTPANVTVKYYYQPSYLKPTMISVTGSSSWNYGDSNTPTDKTIPTLQWSETPITQAQFDAVFPDRISLTTANGDNYYRCGKDGASSVTCRATSALPAEYMTWYAAIAYCNKLSLLEGKTPCYSIPGITALNLTSTPDGSGWAALQYSATPLNSGTEATTWDAATCNFAADGYRLPTESEWEYAARGGTQTHNYYFSGGGTGSGDTQALDTLGWYSGNNGTTGQCPNSNGLYYGIKPVKTKKPNELGLYDMSGNVYEWCWNWRNDNGGTPFSTPTDTRAYVTTTGSYRAQHGGSWSRSATDCRVSVRNHDAPSSHGSYSGLRVVCKE